MMTRRTFTQLLTGAVSAHALPATAVPVAASPIRFSVMLWTLEQHASFDQCLGIVADAGYGSVELVGEFHKWSPAETSDVLRRLRTLNLSIDAISGVATGFAIQSGAEQFMQQFKEQVRWALDLHCPKIILLSGDRVDSVSASAQMQASVDALLRASDVAAQNGLNIVIEPIDVLENPHIFMSSVTQAFEIVHAVNRPNLNVLYDLYHEQRGFGNLIQKLVDNIDRVKLIHIADVPGRHAPGTGEIDYDSVYKRLASLHYTGYIAMEFLPTADPVTELQRAREAALRSLGAPA